MQFLTLNVLLVSLSLTSYNESFRKMFNSCNNFRMNKCSDGISSSACFTLSWSLHTEQQLKFISFAFTTQ
jgi:hypothetical protein